MGLVGYDEGGYVSVDRVSRQKAKKEYQCGECERTINVGEVYRRDFQVCDGYGDTNFLCDDCDDLAARFHKAAIGLDLTFHYGDLRSAIRDLYHEFDRKVEGHDYPPSIVHTKEPTMADWVRAGFNVPCESCDYGEPIECYVFEGRALCDDCYEIARIAKLDDKIGNGYPTMFQGQKL